MRKMNKNLFLVKRGEQKSEACEEQKENVHNQSKINSKSKNEQSDTQSK